MSLTHNTTTSYNDKAVINMLDMEKEFLTRAYFPTNSVIRYPLSGECIPLICTIKSNTRLHITKRVELIGAAELCTAANGISLCKLSPHVQENHPPDGLVTLLVPSSSSIPDLDSTPVPK